METFARESINLAQYDKAMSELFKLYLPLLRKPTPNTEEFIITDLLSTLFSDVVTPARLLELYEMQAPFLTEFKAMKSVRGLKRHWSETKLLFLGR